MTGEASEDRSSPAGFAAGNDDYALMQRIAQRDASALAQFYDRHGKIVMALCDRMLGQRSDAEDLLIDIFQEVWARYDRYDPQRANPLTYLMTLTRSRAIDRLRSRPKQKLTSLDEALVGSGNRPSMSPGDAIESDELRNVLNSAMRSLDAAQRQAIECSFFEGLSHTEIAAKLNKPLGTIKTYIRLGLIRLRDRLRTKERDDL